MAISRSEETGELTLRTKCSGKIEMPVRFWGGLNPVNFL